MAIVLYRCQSCGELHEAGLRPGGSVYLRCVVTRAWAWHEPSHFLTGDAPAVQPARSARKAAAPTRVARASKAPARRPVARTKVRVKKTAAKSRKH
jgi:hypothetical protein